MKETLSRYVKRVNELAELVRGNEEATKLSLVAPLLTALGYDLTDPRECKPEFKADFGPHRSTKPVDWAICDSGRPLFFVEVKAVGVKLPAHDEQLADYFAKVPDVKVGVLTNGVQWRFFTDLVNSNVMDKEPFVCWDVSGTEEPPYDFLRLLQKEQFNPQLIRTFAERKRAHNLLIAELGRLLEPAPEFIKMAVVNIETRNLTANVLDTWKPIVASAIDEWAKQRALSIALAGTTNGQAVPRPEPKPRQPRTRDPRLPPPGTTIATTWRGKKIEAVEQSDGTFTISVDGQVEVSGARSLSGAAGTLLKSAGLGGGVNGYDWFGLKKQPDGQPAPGTN